MARPALPWFLCLSLSWVPALQGQEPSFLASGGLGRASGAWAGYDPSPGTYAHGSFATVTFEAGAGFRLSKSQELRLIVGGTDGALANQQLALDWTCVVFRSRERSVFVLAGPTLNFISGDYMIQTGAEPPYGHGLRAYIDQRWRPGLKLGAGFQWSRYWSAELDCQFVNMKRSGYQSVPDAFTGYVAGMATFHFGR